MYIAVTIAILVAITLGLVRAFLGCRPREPRLLPNDRRWSISRFTTRIDA